MICGCCQIEASTRSTNKSFKKLIADKLATPESIYETLCNQTVDLVLTAHPTQVPHRTPVAHPSSRLQIQRIRHWLARVVCHSTISKGGSPKPVETAGGHRPRKYLAAAAQALRQSLLKKYSSVRHDLDELHNSRMSAYEKAECLESIRAQIQSAWRTDEIRRSKPSPQVLLRSPCIATVSGASPIHPGAVTRFR